MFVYFQPFILLIRVAAVTGVQIEFIRVQALRGTPLFSAFAATVPAIVRVTESSQCIPMRHARAVPNTGRLHRPQLPETG